MKHGWCLLHALMLTTIIQDEAVRLLAKTQGFVEDSKVLTAGQDFYGETRVGSGDEEYNSIGKVQYIQLTIESIIIQCLLYKFDVQFYRFFQYKIYMENMQLYDSLNQEVDLGILSRTF